MSQIRFYANGDGLLHVTSATDESKEYIISRSHLLSRYLCTCPDFVYRRLMRGEDCKHIQALVQLRVEMLDMERR